jgi:putative ABC transport system permease protein
LLLEEFLTLVVIAAIIAIPISWWSTNNWLQNFAYRTGISWWIFVADILIVLVITLLTLGAHTFKAANADPVRSIRNE